MFGHEERGRFQRAAVLLFPVLSSLVFLFIFINVQVCFVVVLNIDFKNLNVLKECHVRCCDDDNF